MIYARTAVTRMTLDMSRLDLQRSETVTQGDTNRRWEVTLTNGGAPFRLPPNWTAALTGIKPDGMGLLNGCSVVDGKIVYDFAAGAEIATCAGNYPVQFDIWDEVGDLVASPKLYINVLADVRPHSELDSNGQYTIIGELIGRVNQTDTDVDLLAGNVLANGDKIEDLKKKVTTAGNVTIHTEAWRDLDPTTAYVAIQGGEALIQGGLLLVTPADKATKDECERAGVRIDIDLVTDQEPPSLDQIVFVRADEVPAIPLNFKWFVVKSESKQAAVVALIGVDAYGEGGGAASGVDEEAVKALIDKEVPEWARAKQKPTYTPEEVKARPATWTPTAEEIGARPSTWMPTAAEVGARPNTWTPTAANVGADPEGTAQTLVNDLARKTAQDLANYYTKDQTLTKDEINALVSAIPKFKIEVVTSLPASNISETTVYLVKSGADSSNLYTEYIRANGAWERLGTQTVDLTGYATEAWVNELIAAYVKTADMEEYVADLLKAYITKDVADGTYQPAGDYPTTDEMDTAISEATKDLAPKSLIPIRVSQLTNDSGYITETEADKKYATPDMIQSGGESETPTLLIPPSITVAAGVERLIYKDCLVFTRGSLDNWDVRITVSKQSSDPALAVYNDADHLSILATSDNVGIAYTATIQVLDRRETKRAEASVQITVVGGGVSGKTALVIGDSNTFSRGGLYTAEIQQNLSGGGVNFIGTQVGAGSSNGIGDVRHEGYNGAAASNSGKGFTEQYVVGTTPNPFYNSAVGGFDFAFYMQNQGYSGVSAVCINLGSNMIGAGISETVIDPYNEMIASIRAYDPDIKIVLGLAIPVASQEAYRLDSHTANQIHNRWASMIRAIIDEFGGREDEGIYLAELCHCIDRAYDFPVVEAEPCARGRVIHYDGGSPADETVTVTRQSDRMHPHRVGLLKMADALWPSLLRGLQAHTGSGDVVMHKVTNNLNNVSNPNPATEVAHGASYSATLTADSGYVLGEVTVTMGVDAVSVTGGVISIASVTGDIVITAVGVEGVTNLADPSKLDNSNLARNADVWLNGYAWSYVNGNAEVSDKPNAIVTNRIPVNNGETLIIEGIKTAEVESKNRFRVVAFDADGNNGFTSYHSPLMEGQSGYDWVDHDRVAAEGVIAMTVNDTNQVTAYVRISGYPLTTSDDIKIYKEK